MDRRINHSYKTFGKFGTFQKIKVHFPFGGIGNSGLGAYHGKNTFKVFTYAKPVLKTATWLDPALKYPPFKGKMKWFRRLIG